MGIKERRLVESVLFSATQPVSVDDIKEATGLAGKEVSKALEELIQSYNEELKRDTAIEIIKAGNKYTMQVKKQYTDQTTMVAKPEIQQQLLKTLALIAFHQPIKQSNLRHMVGPKIYDHVDDLVDLRLVHSKKHGATEMLTTTKLFPEYFGINSTDPEDIREYLAKKVINPCNKE